MKLILEQLIEELVNEAFGGFNLNTFKQISAKDVRPRNKEEERDFAYGNKEHPEIAYAKEHLHLLGKGSSRIAFALTSSKVLKIAMNNIGIAQNQAELEIFTHNKDNSLVTRIFDFSPDYKWLISELVKEFDEDGNEFEKFTQLPMPILDVIKSSLSFGAGLPSDVQKLKHIVEDKLQLNLSYAQRNAQNEYFEDDERKAWIQRAEKIRNALLNFENTMNNPTVASFLTGLLKMMKTHKLSAGDLIPNHFGRTADGQVRLLDSGATTEVMEKYY